MMKVATRALSKSLDQRRKIPISSWDPGILTIRCGFHLPVGFISEIASVSREIQAYGEKNFSGEKLCKADLLKFRGAPISSSLRSLAPYFVNFSKNFFRANLRGFYFAVNRRCTCYLPSWSSSRLI